MVKVGYITGNFGIEMKDGVTNHTSIQEELPTNTNIANDEIIPF